MNIDRNNYEEYFLLFADNELTDSEKVEVIMFLKENRDLEEEFRMVHYTISKPDAGIALADKSFLLRKNEESFINEKNYEEIFVLYHDNELIANEKLETEKFLSRNVQLKNEFDLIGLARLTPEASVIFTGKKLLYKKEKPGKVVPVMFWRALAAAIFLGSGLWITQSYFQKPQQLPAETVQKTTPAGQTSPAVEKKILPEKKAVNAIVQALGKNSPLPSTGIIPKKEKFQKSSLRDNTNSSALLKTPVQTQKTALENVTNQPPEKINNEIVITNQQIKSIPNDHISVNTIEPSKELVQNAILANENVRPVSANQNAPDVSNSNDNSQNYVFYDITTEEFKKTRVGGFLKKVRRVIERNNPISRLLSGDERQVVSN